MELDELIAHAEALEQVARRYYVDDLTEKEIQSQYGGQVKAHNQTAVSRLKNDAKRLGVVSFTIDKGAAFRGVPNKALSSDLRRNFRLRQASVYDLPKGMSGKEIHTALANHAADDPQSRIRIADNEHVAVAGGRAVCSFARAFSRCWCEPVRNVTVSPLGGHIWLGRIWMLGEGRELERPLNPDYAALVLASALNSTGSESIRFSQISHGLHCSSKKRGSEIMKSQCPFLRHGKWNWGLPVPTQAVCGVGVFDPLTGHRGVQFLDRARGRERGPLFNQLRAAQSDCKKHGLPYFGDVANRTFAALPLALGDVNVKSLDDGYEKLIPQLRAVNDRCVVMDWMHLRSIASADKGNVHLLAGGQEKLQVLWTVLLAGYFNENHRLVSSVYTDDESAKALLVALDALESSPQKAWYRKMTAMVFAP